MFPVILEGILFFPFKGFYLFTCVVLYILKSFICSLLNVLYHHHEKMILNPHLAFSVYWDTQYLLSWDKGALMMPSSFGFCCSGSCAWLLSSGYLWCFVVLMSLTVAWPSCKTLCQCSYRLLFSHQDVGTEICRTRSAMGADRNRKCPVPDFSCFLCPEASSLVAWSRRVGLACVLSCLTFPGH